MNSIDLVSYLVLIYIEITEAGRQAFAEHSAALREILESNHKIGNNESRDKSKGHTI